MRMTDSVAVLLSYITLSAFIAYGQGLIITDGVRKEECGHNIINRINRNMR